VLIPSKETQSSWSTLGDCVWGGPSWFTFQTRLVGFPEYKQLYSLFVGTLELENASLQHFLNNLKHIKSSNSSSAIVQGKDIIAKLYEELNQQTVEDSKSLIR
jgi:hypothetical protein